MSLGASIRDGRDLDRYHDPRDQVDLESERRVERAQETAARRRMQERPTSYRVDATAARALLEGAAADTGHSLGELVGVLQRGRLAAERRPLYNRLAELVVDLRDRGFTLEVIGEAIGKDKKAALRLEEHARRPAPEPELAEPKPCRRHDIWKPDCPACGRNAPDRLPAEQPTGVVVGNMSSFRDRYGRDLERHG